MNTLQNLKKQLAKTRDQKDPIIRELQTRIDGQEDMIKKLSQKLTQYQQKQILIPMGQLQSFGYVWKSEDGPNQKKYLIVDVSSLSQSSVFVSSNQVKLVNYEEFIGLFQKNKASHDQTEVFNQYCENLLRQIEQLQGIVKQLRVQIDDLKKKYEQDVHHGITILKPNSRIQKWIDTNKSLSTPQILLSSPSIGDSSDKNKLGSIQEEKKSFSLSIPEVNSHTIRQDNTSDKFSNQGLESRLIKQASTPLSEGFNRQRQKMILKAQSDQLKTNQILEEDRQSQTEIGHGNIQQNHQYKRKSRKSRKSSGVKIQIKQDKKQQIEEYPELKPKSKTKSKQRKSSDKDLNFKGYDPNRIIPKDSLAVSQQKNQLKLTTYIDKDDENRQQKLKNAPPRPSLDEIPKQKSQPEPLPQNQKLHQKITLTIPPSQKKIDIQTQKQENQLNSKDKQLKSNNINQNQKDNTSVGKLQNITQLSKEFQKQGQEKNTKQNNNQYKNQPNKQETENKTKNQQFEPKNNKTKQPQQLSIQKQIKRNNNEQKDNLQTTKAKNKDQKIHQKQPETKSQSGDPRIPQQVIKSKTEQPQVANYSEMRKEAKVTKKQSSNYQSSQDNIPITYSPQLRPYKINQNASIQLGMSKGSPMSNARAYNDQPFSPLHIPQVNSEKSLSSDPIQKSGSLEIPRQTLPINITINKKPSLQSQQKPIQTNPNQINKLQRKNSKDLNGKQLEKGQRLEEKDLPKDRKPTIVPQISYVSDLSEISEISSNSKLSQSIKQQHRKLLTQSKAQMSEIPSMKNSSIKIQVSSDRQGSTQAIPINLFQSTNSQGVISEGNKFNQYSDVQTKLVKNISSENKMKTDSKIQHRQIKQFVDQTKSEPRQKTDQRNEKKVPLSNQQQKLEFAQKDSNPNQYQQKYSQKEIKNTELVKNQQQNQNTKNQELKKNQIDNDKSAKQEKGQLTQITQTPVKVSYNSENKQSQAIKLDNSQKLKQQAKKDYKELESVQKKNLKESQDQKLKSSNKSKRESLKSHQQEQQLKKSAEKKPDWSSLFPTFTSKKVENKSSQKSEQSSKKQSKNQNSKYDTPDKQKKQTEKDLERSQKLQNRTDIEKTPNWGTVSPNQSQKDNIESRQPIEPNQFNKQNNYKNDKQKQIINKKIQVKDQLDQVEAKSPEKKSTQQILSSNQNKKKAVLYQNKPQIKNGQHPMVQSKKSKDQELQSEYELKLKQAKQAQKQQQQQLDKLLAEINQQQQRQKIKRSSLEPQIQILKPKRQKSGTKEEDLSQKFKQLFKFGSQQKPRRASFNLDVKKSNQENTTSIVPNIEIKRQKSKVQREKQMNQEIKNMLLNSTQYQRKSQRKDRSQSDSPIKFDLKNSTQIQKSDKSSQKLDGSSPGIRFLPVKQQNKDQHILPVDQIKQQQNMSKISSKQDSVIQKKVQETKVEDSSNKSDHQNAEQNQSDKKPEVKTEQKKKKTKIIHMRKG